jgi:phosphatidylglycerol:prolipoprotein diacylglycerol transferase
MLIEAVITIGINPEIHLGPLNLAWHGLMIAVGVFVGGWLADRFGREQGLDTETVVSVVTVIALAGIVGARVFYLVENGDLVHPGEWLGTTGFSFYGAIIVGVPATAIYLHVAKASIRYLDALAAGFPLGMAVGRIGDLINGEHYGPESDLPWAVQYTHPNADVPSNAVAYHSGGLYEIVLAIAMLGLLWPLRSRFREPTSMLWAVIGLYGVGRFLMFFVREDSDEVLIGLSSAQLTSIALVAIAVAGAWTAHRLAAQRPSSVSA